MSDGGFQTEYEFTLPRGYVDSDGTLHKEGRMRLATAADEIEPLKDPRVQSNSSYLTVILLARVVTELGDLDSVNRTVIENLFVSDLEYLQDMYERINDRGTNAVDTACPDCGHEFAVSVTTGTPTASTTDAVPDSGTPADGGDTRGAGVEGGGPDEVPTPGPPEGPDGGETGNSE